MVRATKERRGTLTLAVLCTTVLSMTTGVAGSAWAADQLILRAEDEQRSVDCKGLDVLIEGNRNSYTLRGGCNSVLLRGENDKVHATMVPGGHITVEGNEVQITWSVLGTGADPVISLNGRDTQATRETEASRPALALLPPPMLPLPTPPAKPAPPTVTASLPATPPPPVPKASVPASPGPPTLAPPTLAPAAPALHAGPPASPPSAISVPMPSQTTPPPRSASVSEPPPPAPVPTKPPEATKPPVVKGPPIEITLNNEARDLDCAGRDVHISADNGLYALRGGCSAVIVHGNDNLVQAELLPGAKVDLVGKNISLAYVQMGSGDPPKVHTDGDKTKAWAISSWGSLTGPLPKK